MGLLAVSLNVSNAESWLTNFTNQDNSKSHAIDFANKVEILCKYLWVLYVVVLVTTGVMVLVTPTVSTLRMAAAGICY